MSKIVEENEIEMDVIEEDKMEEKKGMLAKGKSFITNHKKSIIAGVAIIAGGLLIKKGFSNKGKNHEVSDDENFDEFVDDTE